MFGGCRDKVVSFRHPWRGLAGPGIVSLPLWATEAGDVLPSHGAERRVSRPWDRRS